MPRATVSRAVSTPAIGTGCVRSAKRTIIPLHHGIAVDAPQVGNADRDDGLVPEDVFGREEVRLRAPQRVAIETSLPSHPVVVAASADRLSQAFRKIVDNAISFTTDGGRVTIVAMEVADHAVIRIDDEGPGLPPEHLERVFDRFFTFRPLGEGQRRDHDGLGLAIARAIVDGYGGSIAATNLTPRGARFEVRFPLARA